MVHAHSSLQKEESSAALFSDGNVTMYRDAGSDMRDFLTVS